ncbi:MAG: hypothetical protein AAF615_05820 [Pseudomonadota bacterium]
MVKWLLLPHFASATFFCAAFAAWTIAGHNRSTLDLGLAVAGYICGLGAVAATLLAVGLVLVQGAERVRWPWLILHALSLAGVVWLAGDWLGGHIA